ncbi:invasion associated locus B family protein [Mesorhizobium sp.]|uniref:invasion associated locus B family protein n=1 Tax=Mesorhizobium sp. TaxID=1871066 RepID=UPI000FEA5BEE|nr:invasion associated locus B family protein [Mesorhizobium sp.]RWQ61003.1 MAG: invasion associated locus B family protein [Mesorhizobium sp.]
MIRNGAVMNSWLWGLGHSRLGLSRLGLSRLGLSRSLAKAILLAAASSVGLSGVGLCGIGLSYVGSFGVSQANAAQPSGKVRTTHGAWSIICDTPAGATSEQCVMMQNVVAEDRPEMGLSVVVLRTADNKAEILRVLAPLGVLLPNGLGLNVDGKDIGRAYFVRCFQDGCYAEVILEKPLLDTLKTGTSATFIVFQTPEEGIGIPVELKGFADGFAALP